MPDEKKKPSQSGIGVVDALAGKPVPGGISSTAFQRVINVLREVIGNSDKKKKQNEKTQAQKLFGE